MHEALRFLTQHITYEVPPQNLDIALCRMPAIPTSRFKIRNAQITNE
jgi:fatty-acid peroxygenase